MNRVRMRLLLVFLLLSACSPTGSKQYLPPYVPPQKIVDLNSESFDPKADILFVVDNSGSMGTHQANLASNISLFTSVFLKSSVLNYNIAVISTDSVSGNPCCGRFYGTTRIVNNQTPNANAVLASNLYLGTDGDVTEKVFDPLFMALSEPNLSGWNAGFLRKDASLIVIFITDAEDQSYEHPIPQDAYDFLVNLKDGDKRKVLAFGAIVPTGDNSCSRDEYSTTPKRIEAFLGLVQPNGTNILNLCAPDYGQRLAQFAQDIVNQVSSVIYLSRAPVLSSIHVMYGNIELPKDYAKGWSFDPETNAIHLGSQIDWASQPVGSRIQVYYNAARFDEEKP